MKFDKKKRGIRVVPLKLREKKDSFERKKIWILSAMQLWGRKKRKKRLKTVVGN